jgi:hypothetical protein
LFYVVKELIDGFEFFENDIFYQIFNINLNKNNMKKIRFFFQKYFRNICKKIITKVVKKLAGVAHVILFTP